MKTKLLIVTAILLGFVGSIQAQTKIGYTNAEYILSLLPEAKQIDADLRAYEKQLQNQMEAKYKELQAKFAEYQANEATYTDLVKADKQSELTQMQESFQKFQVDAEGSLAEKRNKLLQPAIKKITDAIEQVAEENGFTHIFSAGSPGFDVLLYAKEEYDVTPLILDKLGIDAPASPEAGGN
jgi:outer membrane protein